MIILNHLYNKLYISGKPNVRQTIEQNVSNKAQQLSLHNFTHLRIPVYLVDMRRNIEQIQSQTRQLVYKK